MLRIAFRALAGASCLSLKTFPKFSFTAPSAAFTLPDVFDGS